MSNQGVPTLTVTPTEPQSKLSVTTASTSTTSPSTDKAGVRLSLRSADTTQPVKLAKSTTTSRPVTPWYVSWSRVVVESKSFNIFTMLLTVYALCGSDLKLLFTDQPADEVFDYITGFCILVFTAEVVICILGKDDYFMSFFMFLDVVSTITLLLDLTMINDLILGDEEELKNVRGSRTAKIGARATRLVRVIRLVRILKLYKAVYEANQAKKRRKARGLNPGDDDDDWEDVDINVRNQFHRESRVGKKLSELTTRRVICLVLTMMLLHKILRIDTSQQFPTSSQYGADEVYQAFKEYEQNKLDSELREAYERALLQYVYYHNWYTGHRDSCPGGGNHLCSADYQSHLFWVGMISNSEVTAREKADEAQVREATVTEWADVIDKREASGSSWIFNYGPLPPAVQMTLGERWTRVCPTNLQKTPRIGISLLDEETEFDGVEVNYPVTCPESLRRVERKKYAPSLGVDENSFKNWHIAFYFDLRPFVKWECIFSLMITAYICFALCTASIMFSNDANRLVLHPVENMISKVETIRDNPLSAMKVADEEFKVEEMNRAKARRAEATQSMSKVIKDKLLCNSKAQAPELMETVILEKTIIKLGSLLALGFGQAGAQIIEHNMHGVDSACVDAMIEGTRVECIIGATRIRDFSTATEVLQSKVMTFVNQIAEIVHGVVDEFHGYASKNNGDFFLMIWRKQPDMNDAKLSKLADMSMLAFARILGAVHRSPVLAAYRGHPGLQQRLGKNCRVNLSSGLHYGWAIEGAVGSEFKIDASYLSPNVSIAESVERATQIYGVSILVATSVVSICSQPVAGKCRLIDRVIITGSVQPMELYCIDLDYMSLTVEPPPIMQINWTSRQRFRVRQFLEAEKAVKWHEEAHMVNLFNENPEIASMRFRYTLEFIHVFNMGYQNYAQGEWQVAQRLLSRTRTMLGVVDGPSLALLRFMESPYQFKAPETWSGIRDLGMAGAN